MTKNIEFNFLLFGFMSNFVWEMMQMPLFAYPAAASLTEINMACVQAAAGDALMLVIMFWIFAVVLKSRHWLFHLTPARIALFLLPGIAMTVAFEALATGPLHRWVYAEAMPTLPILGTGLAPIVQWLVLPPFILWLVRRQMGNGQ